MSDAIKFKYWTNEALPELRENNGDQKKTSHTRLDYMLHIQWLSNSLRKPNGILIKKMPQTLKEVNEEL